MDAVMRPNRVNGWIVRSADFAACPGLAVAANVSFDEPHRSNIELEQRQLWDVFVDQAPAKVRIGMLWRRKSASSPICRTPQVGLMFKMTYG
jgi:hypothetical protein